MDSAKKRKRNFIWLLLAGQRYTKKKKEKKVHELIMDEQKT